MGVLHLIGFKYTLWKYFSHPKSSTCSANLNSGVFGKLIFENTIWPNYFCKKLFLCPIHMAWSLVKVFGSRGRSIRVGEFIWFLEHLQTTVKHSIKAKTKHSKVFVRPHFSMIYWLKCCGMKIRVWHSYPPYKNLVPEIPRLGAERSMESWIWGSLQVLMLLLLPCGAPLNLKYLMMWLHVWRSSWSRLLMGGSQ